jgi:tetratricopeptide (TPR) repeat protein/tRNA A-37 threonylcarbamoyl transferase component Bud32
MMKGSPDKTICLKCGAPLTGDARGGFCPKCLFAQASAGDFDDLSQDSQIDPPGTVATGLPLPRTFGDYELLEEVARGGMGIVFKARQRKLDRLVAVKLILAGKFASREQVLRFRAEVESAARLQHPNIVRIHETGEQEGQPYFSMDYVEGTNLATLVREKPLPAKRAAGYVKVIAEAIHYAHEQGILHRDLKPSNVLIDATDQPRVTDFGLAKRMQKESFLTVTGDVMGSPNFMPPEQAGGKGVKAGRYSDVYSLGGILFYLVTGRPPFVAENVAETLQQVLNTDPVSPRLLNPSVPQDIATICLKCLEKEPAKRYQTAHELVEELKHFLNGEPIHARPVSRVERLWRWGRRRPVAAAALAIAVIAIGLAAMVSFQARHAGEQRRAERRQTALDNALLAARSGNLNEAEKSIALAELAGASASELRLLRGQVAFHRGDYQEALLQLNQAARLSPESVAIHATLSVIHSRLGQWSESERLLQKADKLTARTHEDYLFRGLAETERDPVRALASLDAAVRLRASAMAILVRSQVRVWHAMMTADPVEVERAITELCLAKDMIPDDPSAIASIVSAYLAAANIYGEVGQTNQRSTALTRAQAEADALKRHPRHLEAVLARVFYFDYVGDEEALLAELRRACEESVGPLLNHFYGLALYRRGDFPAALAVMDRGTQTAGGVADHFRSYVLVELPDGPERALEDFHRIWPKLSPSMETFALQTIPRLLGRKAEAIEACRNFRPEFGAFGSWRNGWFQRVLAYNCDLIDSNEFLKDAGASRWNQCEAHFHIGITCLADGDRSAAREHFKKCVAVRIFYSFEYQWGRAFLARLEQNPSWPPWIPIKPEP